MGGRGVARYAAVLKGGNGRHGRASPILCTAVRRWCRTL